MLLISIFTRNKHNYWEGGCNGAMSTERSRSDHHGRGLWFEVISLDRLQLTNLSQLIYLKLRYLGAAWMHKHLRQP